MPMMAGEGGRLEAGKQVPASSLFLAFLRLGLTAFGGPAIVVYIRDLAVEKKQWLSKEMFEDGVPLCQSIPGATAMQAVNSRNQTARPGFEPATLVSGPTPLGLRGGTKGRLGRTWGRSSIG